MYLEMYLDKHNIECAKGLLKQNKFDVVSRDIARTLVQRLSHEKEDNDLDDELDGDYVILEEIGKDSESEEFDDEDNADDDDDDDEM